MLSPLKLVIWVCLYDFDGNLVPTIFCGLVLPSQFQNCSSENHVSDIEIFAVDRIKLMLILDLRVCITILY